MSEQFLSAQAIRALLSGHPAAEQVHYVQTIDSTNTMLKQLARDGAPAGTVLLAEAQTAGRGRLGRSFYSAPGVGIYLSMLLRPDCPPDALMTLTAQAAVAVRRAIAAVCGVRADIKWVNDLLLYGKKICGILTELIVSAGDCPDAVVGVGINCCQAADAFPPELRGIAGSLFSETGIEVDRNRLTAALIRELSALPALDWQREYREACVTVGKPVVVNGETVQAIDIGSQAELIVRRSDGQLCPIRAGEVTLASK